MISELYMMLSGQLFSRWPTFKSKLLNGTETSFRCAMIFKWWSLVLKRQLWFGRKKKWDGAKDLKTFKAWPFHYCAQKLGGWGVGDGVSSKAFTTLTLNFFRLTILKILPYLVGWYMSIRSLVFWRPKKLSKIPRAKMAPVYITLLYPECTQIAQNVSSKTSEPRLC